VSRERVAEELRARGSLVAAVDALRGSPRTLAPIASKLEPALDELVPDAAVLAPEKPCGPTSCSSGCCPSSGGPSSSGSEFVRRLIGHRGRLLREALATPSSPPASGPSPL